MKIKYRFANGEVSEVEVDDELGAVITASRREEENYERKMRYHCPYSIDKLVYEGEDYEKLRPAVREDVGKDMAKGRRNQRGDCKATGFEGRDSRGHQYACESRREIGFGLPLLAFP